MQLIKRAASRSTAFVFSLLLVAALVLAACDGLPTDTSSESDQRASSTSSPSSDPAAGEGNGKAKGYRIVWDRFEDGFSAEGDARWFYFGAGGPYVGDDGVETAQPYGLRVVSGGTNAATGEPAFTRTLGLEGSADNPLGLSGGLDHVKWLVFMNHIASSGAPGFDAVEGQELSCEATMSGQTFGTAGHPFGSAVTNAQDDPRLAAVAMNAVDFESLMVFDFFISNERIYALYERLPFAQSAANNYASFTFLIPLAERVPSDDHNLKIVYDKAAGTVRWLIEDQEAFQVDRIGHLIDRQYMVLDHGGVEQDVSPNQLSCGMGMFTLLDAHGPAGTGLVKLSNAPGFYFSPPDGAPTPEVFVDDQSRPESRLFGQGTELRIRQYVVSSRPSAE